MITRILKLDISTGTALWSDLGENDLNPTTEGVPSPEEVGAAFGAGEYLVLPCEYTVMHYTVPEA